ncbi:MAG TPA: endonuclease V [Nocardioidaceae bacterium]|nr:endonuclease V [Nocardioidaceae bacterium]
MWPSDAEALRAVQQELAAADREPWPIPAGVSIGGCWVCLPRGLTGPGGASDPAWAAAVVMQEGRVVDDVISTGVTGASYEPGLLALRLGPILEKVLRELRGPPDVLMVDATGRDHPRSAGFAVHLGAALGLATVGVTHRPLVAEGDWPGDRRGDTSALWIGDDVVAAWVRTQPEVRPLVVHPGWRLDLQQAVELVLTTTPLRRTPEPLRQARHLARRARAAAGD